MKAGSNGSAFVFSICCIRCFIGLVIDSWYSAFHPHNFKLQNVLIFFRNLV